MTARQFYVIHLEAEEPAPMVWPFPSRLPVCGERVIDSVRIGEVRS